MPGKIFLYAFFTLVCFAGTPQRSLADLVVQVGDAQVTEGGSGYIDVFFQIPGGTTQTYDLAAYMIELDLSGPTTKVDFTQFAEAEMPVFPGSTPQQTSSRPTLPGTIAAANDELPSGANTIVDNAGLIRVLFTTAPGSAGTYTVTIDQSPAHTNFTDGNDQLLSGLTTISYSSGKITVSPVPEPSLIVILITALPIIALNFRKHP